MTLYLCYIKDSCRAVAVRVTEEDFGLVWILIHAAVGRQQTEPPAGDMVIFLYVIAEIIDSVARRYTGVVLIKGVDKRIKAGIIQRLDLVGFSVVEEHIAAAVHGRANEDQTVFHGCDRVGMGQCAVVVIYPADIFQVVALLFPFFAVKAPDGE